ncbi:MAG: tRNA 2-thiouridine(34) synthase MnmA [Oscillospiraceae bacterium]|nr:tRNA 2-thiouridine(34) synthase MnmA [Oscillospiraceae bacterium]
MQTKALIAMSGGVDSSVAAYLTKSAGFQCIGATMRLYGNGILGTQESTCCSLDDVEDARSVALTLGMPFYVFNFTENFRKNVMDKFVDCYECGLTPNPCIDCNRYLKFAHLLERAKLLGCEKIVTGHYARIRQDNITGRYLLYKATDISKDQSYVLYSLTQDQLAHTLLPLGELTKTQARQLAEENGFLNARKKDSQDICFVPDGDYTAFMERYTAKQYPAGDFLDQDGNVIGRHAGAVRYTLGQRKGLGLAMGEPVYVCEKNMANNTVTVGPNEALYKKILRANDWNWFPFPVLTEPMRIKAKCRYRHAEQAATVYPEADGFARVEFEEPQRAITPGQAVVLYEGDQVIGGGTITEVL